MDAALLGFSLGVSESAFPCMDRIGCKFSYSLWFMKRIGKLNVDTICCHILVHL